MDTKQQPAAPTEAESLRRELAHKIGCITADELAILAAAKDSTIIAWAKRGIGPPYAILGNTKLIPIGGLAEHVQSLVRERRGVDAGSLL